jgi:hypothetical protein
MASAAYKNVLFCWYFVPNKYMLAGIVFVEKCNI